MGSSKQEINKQSTNQFKMAFYIYGEPVFSTEHFHPGFFQPSRSLSRPRHWNLLENLFDPEETAYQSCCSSTSTKKSVENSSTSTTDEGKMDQEISKTNEGNKDLEPVTKTVSKRFMSKVTFQETMEKVEIKIQFGGQKFKAKNLDVQVVNENILVVKADDEEEKFDVKEEDTQTLLINIPKDVKVTQVPISINK